jgi:branched-chain amino acid aminotransferase
LTPVLWHKGRFVADEEAYVSLLDRGYLLGDGVFATMRGYDGACFRPDAHLAQLARGAELFGIELPRPLADIAGLADEAARRTGTVNAYVRVTLTHGPPSGAPTLSLLAREMDLPGADDYARGVDAVTVTPRRIPPACIDGTIKTTSYAVQVIARREVAARGAAEGIQLAVDGSLACGTMSSLFVVVGDQLLTPSLESGCRAGITRGAILELAPRVDLTPTEARLDPSVLTEADEAFFTSTRIECLPIASVDGHAIGMRRDGEKYPRARSLRAALVALIQQETAERRARGAS